MIMEFVGKRLGPGLVFVQPCLSWKNCFVPFEVLTYYARFCSLGCGCRIASTLPNARFIMKYQLFKSSSVLYCSFLGKFVLKA